MSEFMVRMARRALLGPLLLGLAGCGDGKPAIDTSKTEAVVKGVVSIKGTPATGGEIRFNPSNSGRIVPTRTAPIGPDGSYSITTYTGDNVVTFDGEVAARNKGVGLMREYAKVERGEQEINFDLMGEGARRVPYDLSKLSKKKSR
ncbi:MAG: hypothetical protein U0790_07280 [Isosphaeraceae bacterium]